MQKYSHEDYKWLLTETDHFSRCVQLFALRNKTGKEVVSAVRYCCFVLQRKQLNKAAEVILLCQQPLVVLMGVLLHIYQINLNSATKSVTDDGLQRSLCFKLLPLCTVVAIADKFNDQWCRNPMKIVLDLPAEPRQAVGNMSCLTLDCPKSESKVPSPTSWSCFAQHACPRSHEVHKWICQCQEW